MQFFRFLQYFFYVGWNWNFSIAWHMIRKEIAGEKKYGIHTTGADELKNLEKKGIDISHATMYMPASYDVLEEIFSQITPSSYQHIVDIGCGKGRALCVAAHAGFSKVTGIELSKEMCAVSNANLAITKKQLPALEYRIINNDAFYFDIETEVDCIFMFNPFDEVIMSGVVNNIEKSLAKKPRPITVIYLNSLHKNLFLNNGFKQIYQTERLKYLQGIILRKE